MEKKNSKNNWKGKYQKFDYFLVLDFECTCEKNATDYPNEIIEFPVIVLNAKTNQIEKEASFHHYVRPTYNTQLSPFCKELTGITQEQVDVAMVLPDVLEAFEIWRIDNNFSNEDESGNTFAFVTDGPWDLRNFLNKECYRKDIPKEKYFDQWVNVRWQYGEFYKTQRRNVSTMLKNLGLKFEGSPHSGYDDAYNIARIAQRMISDGCLLKINDSLERPIDGDTDNSKYVKYGGLKNPSAK